MKWTLVAALTVVLYSCGGSNEPQTKEEFIEAFENYEDSLMKNTDAQSDTKVGVQYAERCLEIAHKFPKDPEAPKYMDKAHMIFSNLGLHSRSVALADTIITMYPRYENRSMVLLSAATTYDMFIVPRKKDMVKKYYELLLKEDNKLPKKQREEIEFRLKNINLTFDELIELQSSKMKK